MRAQADTQNEFMEGLESIQPVEGGIFKLRFCGGKVLTINSAYLPPELSGVFLCPGGSAGPDFSGPETAVFFHHAAECTAAEKTALRLVARGEQCRRGLERKLNLRGRGAEAIRTALDRLEALDLVNDRRYARLWLKSRLGRGQGLRAGPRTLRQLLAARGIGREDTEAALEETLTAETEDRLMEQCAGATIKKPRKNFASLSPGEQKMMIKRRLKMEGFSAAAIMRYFEE